MRAIVPNSAFRWVLLPLLFACGGSAARNGFGDEAVGNGPAPSIGGPAASAPGNTLPASGGDGGVLEAEECRKMDLVFGIDSSESMGEEQANLAANLPRFIEVLDNYRTSKGEPLDYRIAVTASVNWGGGPFIKERAGGAPSDCDPGPNRPWLERVDGNVAKMFPCRAQVGIHGQGESPLESILRGLTDGMTKGYNTDNGAPFLRDDALLAMVAMTDEDEGGSPEPGKPTDSARPMSEYVSGFDAVKKDRNRWAAAVIAGPTACESAFGKAAEATRLKEFVSLAGKNAVFESICAGDLSESLSRVLHTFDQACKTFPKPSVN